MNSPRYLIPTVWLAAGLCQAQPQSLPSPWTKAIQDVLAVSLPVPSPGGFVLARPALALDPWMDASAPVNQRFLGDLLDSAPSPQFQPGAPKLSAVYQNILATGQWAQSTLSGAERQQLAAALQTLFTDAARANPTNGYRKYLSLKAKVDQLQASWDATPPADRTAGMAADLEEARQNLADDGDPQTYTVALSTVESLTRPSPLEILRRRKEQFDAALVPDPSSGSFPLTGLGPDYTTSVTSGGWTTISIEKDAATVPLSGVWSFETAGGSPVYASSAASRASVSFEYSVVPVWRPWFDPDLFADRAWRWSMPGQPMVSDGDDAAPGGTFPVMISAVILARKIAIQADLPPAEQKALQTNILAGRQVAWGPFALAGRFAGPGGRFFAAQRSGTTLFTGDVQLIGFLTTALPKSPNPNPDYDWRD